MPRNFDGTDDEVVCSIGACGGVGAFTVATLCKRANATGFHCIVAKQNGSTIREDLEFMNNGTQLQLSISASTGRTVTHGLTTTDWNVVVATKAAGSATPRHHAMPVATRTWEHIDYGGATMGNATDDATSVRLGDGNFSGTHDRFAGDVAFVAYWERALSDAEVEAIFSGLNLQHLLASAPAALWLLDQESSAVPVADLTGGGANQSSVAGTTASTQGPPLWSYGAHPQRFQRLFAAGGALTRSFTTSAAHSTAIARAGGFARVASSAIAHASSVARAFAGVRAIASALAHAASVLGSVFGGGPGHVQLAATLDATTSLATTLDGTTAVAATLDGTSAVSGSLAAA